MTTTKHPRVAAALTTAVLMFSVAACGDTEQSSAPEPANDTTTRASADQDASEPESSWPRITLGADRDKHTACMNSAEQPTGAGNAEFGRKAVKRAYCDIAEFTEFYAFTDLMRKRQDDVAAFNGPTEYMTGSLEKWWRKTAMKAVNGNKKAARDIQGIMFHDNGDKRFKFANGAPVVLSRRHTRATADVIEADGGTKLSLQFTVVGLVNRFDTKNGKRRLDRVKRLSTYHLVRNDEPGKPWLIDNYGSESEAKRVK